MADFQFSTELRPRHTDTLTGTNAVSSASLLILAETALVDYLASFNLPPPPDIVGVEPRIEAQFFSPLLANEVAEAKVRASRLGRTSITYEVEIAEASSGRKVASFVLPLVFVSTKTMRPEVIPENVRNAIKGREGASVQVG